MSENTNRARTPKVKYWTPPLPWLAPRVFQENKEETSVEVAPKVKGRELKE